MDSELSRTVTTFWDYKCTFRSPHGSFEMRQLSAHVWVCIAVNDNHRFCRSWVKTDFEKKFILYVGYCPDDDYMVRWVQTLPRRISFKKCELRTGNDPERTGLPVEWRAWGVKVDEVLAIASDDRSTYGMMDF